MTETRCYAAYILDSREVKSVALAVVSPYICIVMKFYDKYPQLKEKGFLTKVLTDTVFSTMSLEDQQVSLPKVRKIVASLLKEQELKGGQFFANQPF